MCVHPISQEMMPISSSSLGSHKTIGGRTNLLQKRLFWTSCLNISLLGYVFRGPVIVLNVPSTYFLWEKRAKIVFEIIYINMCIYIFYVYVLYTHIYNIYYVYMLYMYVRICVYIYVYILCINICICVYTYTHTYKMCIYRNISSAFRKYIFPSIKEELQGLQLSAPGSTGLHISQQICIRSDNRASLCCYVVF